MTDLLKLMTIALKKAANPILRDFNELGFMLNNYNSAVDYAINANEHLANNIYKDLSRFKNKYNYKVLQKNILGTDNSNCFVIDGIVGIKNFVKTVPYFAISMHLVRDSKAYACALYNPITNEMFAAEKDQGAFWNQRKIRFDNSNSPNFSIVADITAASQLNLSNYENVIVTACPALDICYTAANKYSSLLYKGTYNIESLQASLLLASEAKLNLTYTNLNNNQVTSVVLS